ncbi:hypothetical protein QTP70_024886 [Hemibagrus guttatus]|uniref:Uncharacterized protein n=1 Tax=Hemibagrus guttatus TaxID=175788 RepID=A0AAE0R876_9TELE|nr:hypothetical protein QTP70_024886 [Hemibagrus guttatus]
MLGMLHTEYYSFKPWHKTFIYSRVTGSLCLSQASLGIKAGYNLDGVPTHRRAHTHSHSLTQSHTMDNLEVPINLQCMSLKPEYPEETPEARGENVNPTHTWRRQESNPQPWRCEANVLTTKPPCPN